MAVPIPYRKSCTTGSPVLEPPNSAGRLSAIATMVASKANSTYKTEQAISRLRVEKGADCCIAVGVDMINLLCRQIIDYEVATQAHQTRAIHLITFSLMTRPKAAPQQHCLPPSGRHPHAVSERCLLPMSRA